MLLGGGREMGVGCGVWEDGWLVKANLQVVYDAADPPRLNIHTHTL